MLDALAHHRRAAELPAVSINWSGWAAGMAARSESRAAAEKWSHRGIELLEPRDGLDALGRILSRSQPQVGVLAVDFSKLLASAAGAVPPLLSSIASDRGRSSRPPIGRTKTDATRALLRELDGASQSRRRKRLVEHVRAEVARVLGLEKEGAVDVRQALGELGLDALLALELRNSLAASLECNLPLTLVFDYPTIEALGHFLEGQLFPEARAKALTLTSIERTRQPVGGRNRRAVFRGARPRTLCR